MAPLPPFVPALALMAGLLALAPLPAFAGALDERLDAYRAAGAGPFSAEAGRILWTAERAVPGEAARACPVCHTADLKAKGQHVETGKPIEPMAPSVNPDRLTDGRKIEKWLLRNCKWTVGRVCTPQEKGDLLTFIAGQ
jgi:hypothetical protein